LVKVNFPTLQDQTIHVSKFHSVIISYFQTFSLQSYLFRCVTDKKSCIGSLITFYTDRNFSAIFAPLSISDGDTYSILFYIDL